MGSLPSSEDEWSGEVYIATVSKICVTFGLLDSLHRGHVQHPDYKKTNIFYWCLLRLKQIIARIKFRLEI